MRLRLFAAVLVISLTSCTAQDPAPAPTQTPRPSLSTAQASAPPPQGPGQVGGKQLEKALTDLGLACRRTVDEAALTVTGCQKRNAQQLPVASVVIAAVPGLPPAIHGSTLDQYTEEEAAAKAELAELHDQMVDAAALAGLPEQHRAGLHSTGLHVTDWGTFGTVPVFGVEPDAREDTVRAFFSRPAGFPKVSTGGFAGKPADLGTLLALDCEPVERTCHTDDDLVIDAVGDGGQVRTVTAAWDAGDSEEAREKLAKAGALLGKTMAPAAASQASTLLPTSVAGRVGDDVQLAGTVIMESSREQLKLRSFDDLTLPLALPSATDRAAAEQYIKLHQDPGLTAEQFEDKARQLVGEAWDDCEKLSGSGTDYFDNGWTGLTYEPEYEDNAWIREVWAGQTPLVFEVLAGKVIKAC